MGRNQLETRNSQLWWDKVALSGGSAHYTRQWALVVGLREGDVYLEHYIPSCLLWNEYKQVSGSWIGHKIQAILNMQNYVLLCVLVVYLHEFVFLLWKLHRSLSLFVTLIGAHFTSPPSLNSYTILSSICFCSHENSFRCSLIILEFMVFSSTSIS